MLSEFAEDLNRTGAFNIGPHGRSPWFDLFATAQFGVDLVTQVRRVYRVGGKSDLDALWKDASDAFSRLTR